MPGMDPERRACYVACRQAGFLEAATSFHHACTAKASRPRHM